MDTIIVVKGQNIQLEIKTHKIRLANNDQLAALLSHDLETATDELVVAIKTAFRQRNNREFAISDNSIAVEIWGHIYVEAFVAAAKSFSLFSIIDSLAEKIIGHCRIIDIGETGHDNNRFVWDRLASFKSDIAGLLPVMRRK